VLGLEHVPDIDAGPTGSIQRVGTFVARIAPFAYTATDTFNGAAQGVGDLVMLHVECRAPANPNIVAVAAANTSWAFTELGVIVGDPSSGLWGASFWATAPDTDATDIYVTWGLTCTTHVELGDEFANAAVDRHAEGVGPVAGPCAISVGTRASNDAVWAACTLDKSKNDIGSGYTIGADDATGDISEYKYTTDPAGSTEDVRFNTSDRFVVTAASLMLQ
jgi:hypothetical protein